MTKIKPNQDFLDGGKRFKKGRSYDVDPERAAYFASNGWLKDTQASNGEATLDIQNIEHGLEGGL